MRTIRSFREVLLPSRPILLALDIDDTVLYFPEFPPSYWSLSLEKYKLEGYSEQQANQIALDRFREKINVSNPTPTDPEGLLDLLRRLIGSVVFLTARSSSDNFYTRKHLQYLGLEGPIYNSESYYAEKGPVLRQIARDLNLTEIVFIDDSERHLRSAEKYCSDLFCTFYKFVR